jgi:hypothetical protein
MDHSGLLSLLNIVPNISSTVQVYYATGILYQSWVFCNNLNRIIWPNQTNSNREGLWQNIAFFKIFLKVILLTALFI